MRKGLCVLLLCLVAPTAFAVEAEFVGKYHCEGQDPYLKKHYSGTVTVKHENAVYQLDMDYGTGERSRGTGGQWNPMLMSVVFQDTEHKNHIGLEQYQFNQDKTVMQGYWVYLGYDKLGSEVCKRA
jgi:hypothetical protein